MLRIVCEMVTEIQRCGVRAKVTDTSDTSDRPGQQEVMHFRGDTAEFFSCESVSFWWCFCFLFGGGGSPLSKVARNHATSLPCSRLQFLGIDLWLSLSLLPTCEAYVFEHCLWPLFGGPARFKLPPPPCKLTWTRPQESGERDCPVQMCFFHCP